MHILFLKLGTPAQQLFLVPFVTVHHVAEGKQKTVKQCDEFTYQSLITPAFYQRAHVCLDSRVHAWGSQLNWMR